MESKIILFSQPTCGMCRTVHMLLDKKGIAYEECQDVDKMKELGVLHTPTLCVDSEMLTGKDIINYINLGSLPETRCESCEVK